MKRFNAIWIFGDQHRAQALGCNGDPNVKTPNLDKLANQGVNFNRALAGYPLCCPFRGSLLTGKYPHKVVPGHQEPLPPEQETIAHVLNGAGYHTAYFGKWHLDGAKEEKTSTKMHVVPPDRRGGFQEWVGYENNNAQWDTWVHGGEGNTAFQYRLEGYETDELTNLLIDYLERRKSLQEEGADDRPFFAVLSVQPPHNPYLAPEEFMERHFDMDSFEPRDLVFRENVPDIPRLRSIVKRELAGAYAMIENLDWNVGRILDAIERLGLDEETHLFFFSDHGDMHGSHGHFRKTTPYEESLRIPFLVRPAWWKRLEDHGPVDALVNHVDIAPTTLALCDVEIPGWMEGTDYSHYLRGEGEKEDEPDSALLQSIIPTGHHDCIDKPWRGIVTRDGWKYVCFEGCDWMMFNLNDDPYEQVNLAHYSRNAAYKRVLREMLVEWLDRVGDEFKVPQ